MSPQDVFFGICPLPWARTHGTGSAVGRGHIPPHAYPPPHFEDRVRKFALPCTLVCALVSSVAAVACTKAPVTDAVGVAPITEADEGPMMTVDAMIARAKTRDYWPVGAQDWRAHSQAEQDSLMESEACRDFKSYLFPAADADAKTAAALGTTVDKLTGEQQALRSEGALVVKGGEIVWEHYTGPYAGHPEKRHCMWSASKSFTTGMMGALVQSSELTKAGIKAPAGKLTKDGKTLGLATTLNELMDASALNEDPRLGKMTIEDLLTMNIPAPIWNEGYDGNITTSSVVQMLWVDGSKDMAKFAGNNLFGPVGPPGGFKYSSGTAVVLMRALKELYGADYDKMPFASLFDRLGMKSTVFERDQNGVFVGSSYAHMNLRDMARFGYAYLNGGFFGGEQVIHPSFIDKARVVGLGMRAEGTTDEAIVEEGSFYSLGFWINPSPKALEREGVRKFGANFPFEPADAEKKIAGNKLKPGQKFFPNVGTDFFFAAGHYGQNIMVFPKDDLMIVRFSHDNEYFSKIDQMMVKARACNLSRPVSPSYGKGG